MTFLEILLLCLLIVSLFFNVKHYRDFIAWRKRYYELQEMKFAPSLADRVNDVANLALKIVAIYGLYTLYRRVNKLSDEQ